MKYKKNTQKKKSYRFMQEDGVGGRHRMNIHAGKEAENNKRKEVIRNSVKDLFT